MGEVWSLPGYDVQALLGAGATGEVWRARELATGDTVALERLRDVVDPVAVEALRRQASLVQSLDTPYVVRPRAVIESGADVVLVLDHAAGGSLATLLARRGSLDPGEVVTIGGPLAQALAAAHSRGVVHGDVSPSSVLFTAEGMPLLSDLWSPRAAGGEPDAAADVRALAAVCHHLLAGSPPQDGVRVPLGRLVPAVPGVLVEAVEAGLAVAPANRPDAAAFAALLRRSHAAAPVRLSAGPPAARPEARSAPAVRTAPPVDAPSRLRLPQGVLLVLGLVVLLLAGGVVGWVSGRGASEAAASLAPVQLPTAAPSGAALPAWEEVLDGLDAARAEAFATGSLAGLAAVYAPGSPGLASDSALLQDLVDRQQTAGGLRHDVRAVEVLQTSGERARLRVVDVLGAYEILDASGAVVSRAGARGEAEFAVDLVRTAEGWRLVEVRPAS